MKLRWGLPVLLGAALIPVWVMAPGLASILTPSSTAQKLWMTSTDVTLKRTGRSFGR